MMNTLPPGTILQQMYLKERLRQIPVGRFIEVGVGQGILSSILLKMGWQGTGFDLNPESVEKACKNNADSMAAGHYNVRCENWLKAQIKEPVDLILSCMVLEHFNDADESTYIKQCYQYLKPGGRIILLVPSSPKHWGIEDDIAGHFRRYKPDSLRKLLESHHFQCQDLAGLTYPLSNLLLPLSNFLVKRQENNKQNLSMDERTRQSGNRNVQFKTTFPSLLKLILNERAMQPWYILQKLNRNNPNALVLYTEGLRLG